MVHLMNCHSSRLFRLLSDPSVNRLLGTQLSEVYSGSNPYEALLA